MTHLINVTCMRKSFYCSLRRFLFPCDERATARQCSRTDQSHSGTGGWQVASGKWSEQTAGDLLKEIEVVANHTSSFLGPALKNVILCV
jgi:hypothetical protein